MTFRACSFGHVLPRLAGAGGSGYPARVTLLPTLRYQFDVSWSLLALHLAELSDEMCLWEPAPGAWTVRERDGRWSADLVLPEPDPPPATTIGWVTWHIGWWWSGAHLHTFGDRRGEPLDMLAHAKTVAWPGSARAVAGWLTGLRDQWARAQDGLADADLERPVAWFGQPLRSTLAWANVELMKNAAEVGQLRLLFTARRR